MQQESILSRIASRTAQYYCSCAHDSLVFAALLRTAAQSNWVVYAKRPFAGPAQVLSYLSRDTHRVAIANS